jgi:hypothetical protein
LLQTPSAVFLQLALSATQIECTQQACPVPAQLLFWQQGAPAVPHATMAPPKHTVAEAFAWPEARQVPLEQQPPPLQVLPAQHA